MCKRHAYSSTSCENVLRRNTKCVFAKSSSYTISSSGKITVVGVLLGLMISEILLTKAVVVLKWNRLIFKSSCDSRVFPLVWSTF